MNLQEYETKNFATYRAFAETVRFILEKAILAARGLPQPQSIQCRAKNIASLRRRLSEAGTLESQTLELDRRDLAGVRLIFYTNNDVDRFLASSLIRENFEIEELAKIHHPSPENEGARYRGVHYTVRLKEDRVRLPEYSSFAELRCEIQVQTILNHAWSETSHDILYKDNLGDGYGGRAMKGISQRFERIMDKYLVPAGFEIQKAQQEYEQVLQGKVLFDKNIANLLDNAQDNNERYEILTGLRDYAIPNYDDLTAAYRELKGPLLRAVKAARCTESVPIETTYGKMEGFSAQAVTDLVVEIVNQFRFIDPVETLQLLIYLYRDESDDDLRQRILHAVKGLSEYNVDVYKQVGPALQMALVDHLAAMTDAEVDRIRPIALIVWTQALKSKITGSTWKADSVVLTTGAMPASDQLIQVRDKAISALCAAYDRSTNDNHRRMVLFALDEATRTPSQGTYSNELLATTLKDATRIVEFVTDRVKVTSYELLQHLEHRFLYDFYRSQRLINDSEKRFGCQAEAAVLIAAIFRFRDAANDDYRFVRYKVLVGYESVYPGHWTDPEFDYRCADEYRREEANRYVDEINAANEDEWLHLIGRCAQTKSSDLATFPVFSNFIKNLAERKPEVAERFLGGASIDLCNFITAFLNGLGISGRPDIYERIFEGELRSARNLAGLARHLRYSDVEHPDFAHRVMRAAIELGEATAVIECTLLALENYETERLPDADILMCDALNFLNDRKDTRWVSGASFSQRVTKFYENLSPERMTQVLQNLSYLPKVSYEVERILLRLAERDPEVVWDYLGTRLAREATSESNEDEGFEAVPYELHGLEKELSKDPQMAIEKGLSWFEQDPRLFRFRGGHLISEVFPGFTMGFSAALIELVKAGGDREAEFTLAILQNYEGDASIHVVLKEIVSQFPNDASKIDGVRVCVDSTGVVSGELGFAEAYRARRESLREWLTDERTTVKAFAEQHIGELGRMIAAEHRRAETRREMRRRDYEEEGADTDGDE